MNPPRVMLIDDEAAFTKNIAHILNLKGYETTIAQSGAEGLKALRDKTHDVVLLDLRMPGISGMEVLKIIDTNRKNSPEVIILTGFASVDAGIEGLSNGAFDFITKPVRIEDLVDRIKAALQRKKQKERN